MKAIEELFFRYITLFLERLLNYGKSWLLEFEVKKTQALTVSRKRDPNNNPPLVMDGIPIAESKTLKILGYTFDCKGLWSAHIEQTVKEARQRLGAINRVKQYLRDEGVCIAYKAFVRSKLEYRNLIYWSAAETHLAKLDRVQQQAQRLFEGVDVPSLEKRREAAAIGLTCRLMSGNMKQPLKPLTPKMRNPNADKPRRSSRLKGPIQQHEHQLQEQTTIRSMEVLKRSYRGRIPSIWNRLESECLKIPAPDWLACRKRLQKKHVDID